MHRIRFRLPEATEATVSRSEDAKSPGQTDKSDGASEGLAVPATPLLASEMAMIGVAVPLEGGLTSLEASNAFTCASVSGPSSKDRYSS